MAEYKTLRRANKILANLDKRYGTDATYIVTSATTIDDMTSGDVTVTTSTTAVVVRELEVNERSLQILPTVNAADVEKMFALQSSYISDVEQGDIIKVGSDEYQVVENGTKLDTLNKYWTIATYKRKV